MHKVFFILFLLPFYLFSQSPSTEVDVAETAHRVKAIKNFEDNHNKFLASIKEKYSGSTRKKMLTIYEEVGDYITDEVNEGKFIYNADISNLVNNVYQEIYTKNPEIPKDLFFLVSKDYSLNAFCFPGGTIIINSGAISYLENEHQLAAIISHEIGHYLLMHSEKQLLSGLNDKKSKENKGSLKEIKKTKYKKSDRAFEYITSKIYAKSELKREQELEADSIAYQIVKKTKYKANEMIRMLDLLQEYDTIQPAGVVARTYKQVFNLPNQAFLEDWLQKEDYSKYDYSKYDDGMAEDSIKSHPDEEKRRGQLKKHFPKLEAKSLTEPPTKEYKEIQEEIKSSLASNLFSLEEYGYVAYVSLLRIQQKYQTKKHEEQLGKAFEKIHEARKNYTANKYLESISPADQTKSYQQFLSFIWNLKLKEIEEIAKYYTKPNS